MGRSTRRLSAAAVLATVTLFAGCGGEDPVGPETCEDTGTCPPPPPPPTSGITEFVESLGEWSDPLGPPIADSEVRESTPYYLVDALGPEPDAGSVDYQCYDVAVKDGDLFDRVWAGQNVFARIYPGAILHGNSLKGGEPRVSPLRRAPMTIAIDAFIAEQSVVVNDPGRTTTNDAVEDLVRGIGDTPLAGRMSFSLAETDSYEETMHGWGITLGYSAGVDLGEVAKVKGSTELQFGETKTKSAREHTIVGKFIQTLFTVSLDDERKEPADFFATGVTRADLEAEFGPGDIPLYVSSITYGKRFLFSSRSDEFESAEEHNFAITNSVQGSGTVQGVPVEGGVTTGFTWDDETKAKYTSSKKGYWIEGGDESAGNAVFSALDWSLYFQDTPPTTAVPLYFEVRSLADPELLIRVVDNGDYLKRAECRKPSSYRVDVTLVDAALTDMPSSNVTGCLSCAVAGRLFGPGGLAETLGGAILTGFPNDPTAAAPFGNSATVLMNATEQSFVLRMEAENGIGIRDETYTYGGMGGLEIDTPTEVPFEVQAGANFYTFKWNLTKKPQYAP
jgi:hypothetical protein